MLDHVVILFLIFWGISILFSTVAEELIQVQYMKESLLQSNPVGGKWEVHIHTHILAQDLEGKLFLWSSKCQTLSITRTVLQTNEELTTVLQMMQEDTNSWVQDKRFYHWEHSRQHNHWPARLCSPNPNPHRARWRGSGNTCIHHRMHCRNPGILRWAWSLPELCPRGRHDLV